MFNITLKRRSKETAEARALLNSLARGGVAVKRPDRRNTYAVNRERLELVASGDLKVRRIGERRLQLIRFFLGTPQADENAEQLGELREQI